MRGLGFLVAVAYLPGIQSAAFAPRWWIVAIGAPLVLAGTPGLPPWSAGHAFALASLASLTASLFWSLSPLDTQGALVWLWLAIVPAYLIGARAVTLAPLWRGLGWGLVANAPIALVQMLGYHPIMGGGVAGLFYNRDLYAELGVVTLVGLVGTWAMNPLLLAGALISALGAGSRGAWVALVCVITVGIMRGVSWGYRIMFVAAISVLVGGGLWFDAGSLARWQTMNNRLQVWELAARNIDPIGWGYGTFGRMIPDFGHVHNEPLEFAIELGWLFVLPLVGMILYALKAPRDAERYALVTLLAVAMVSFPFHNPGTAFVLALVLGRLCACRVGVVFPRLGGRVDGSPGVPGRGLAAGTGDL